MAIQAVVFDLGGVLETDIDTDTHAHGIGIAGNSIASWWPISEACALGIKQLFSAMEFQVPDGSRRSAFISQR
jgi:hypothetical protein